MSPQHSPKTTVGIVGGGQLARMLALKGHEMGLTVRVLSKSSMDPAAQVCAGWVKGDPTRRGDLTAFFKTVSVITFESEFYSGGMFAEISRKTKTRVSPSPRIMGLLQDRLSQKRLLVKYGILTSEFVSVSDPRAAFKTLGPCVFKTRMGGYDGYGTFVVKRESDLAALKVAPMIAERFIPFKAELAVSIVRGKNGTICVLPLVRTCQKDSRCLWVKGPIRHCAFPALVRKLKRLLAAEKYVGICAFELFDTGKELLVNEIAPRVHNSAHYSLDALDEDQFTLHMKAVVAAVLPRAVSFAAKGFAMWNLLGTGAKAPRWSYPAGVHLHWYGKNGNRPGRKMGHINAVGKSPDRALASAKRGAQEIRL
ncbi:MAG: hypothetical protein COB53_04865 [Elusimicrobia bacterium]|nr:MAG: hypothetical protein COB53_04865 [Elusimicrobiota bacterium]